MPARRRVLPGAALAWLWGAAPPLASEVPLSLAQAVERALRGSHQVVAARQALRVAQAGAARAVAAYDPALSLEARVADRTDPVNSLLRGAPEGELGPSQTTLVESAALSKRFGSGASLSLSTTVGRQSTDNVLALLTPSYTSSLGVDLVQPLARDRRIDEARRQVRLARLGEERARLDLARVENDTLGEVEAAYWALVAAARTREVRARSLEIASSQLEEVRARVEAGFLASAELAEPRAAIEARRGDLLAAGEQVGRAENRLKALLLPDAADPWWGEGLSPSDPLEPAAGEGPAPAATDLEAALRTARERRPELAIAALAVRRSDVEEEAARDGTRPRLDLIASYTQRGLAGTENPDALLLLGEPVVPGAMEGGLLRSLGSLVERRFPDASVGLRFAYTLGNREPRARAAAAAASRRLDEIGLAELEQRVVVEVRDAVLRLETARQRIQAARAGLEAAELQLEVERERFRVGAGSSFFVLTREKALAEARLVETAALADLRLSLAELRRAQGTLLATHGVEGLARDGRR